MGLLAQGKDEEALEAYQRYYARRHTSRTRDYPPITTLDELQTLIATDKWQYNNEVIETTLGLAEDGVIDRLQMHFYERWDVAPLLMEFLRSRIPADMPIEAWEVGLFDVDEAKSETALTEEVTKTVSQLLAYGAGRVLWLPLAADPNGSGGEEKRFGLLEPDGTPLPWPVPSPSWCGRPTVPRSSRSTARVCSGSSPSRARRRPWWPGPPTARSRPTGRRAPGVRWATPPRRPAVPRASARAL